MKQTLQLKLTQHLTLTPQLQQSIRLLQLSTLELNAEVDRMLQENPLLEREEGEEEAPPQEFPLAGTAPGPVTTEHSPAAAIRDPALLLVVLVDERTRMTGDIADRDAGHPITVAQPAEATPDEHPVDGRRRSTEQRSEAIGSVSPGRPGREDLGFDARAQSAW